MDTEEAIKEVAKYTYSTQYESTKPVPQAEWEEGRIPQVVNWIEEIYYNESNEDISNQPTFFQKLRSDPANILSKNWVKYMIENWIRWEFEEESPEFEDFFHRLYNNTLQVELSSEEKCECGTILDLTESTGVPQLRDLGITPHKDVWKNGDLWDPYRSFPLNTFCNCGQEKTVMTNTKTKASVVVLVPIAHLDSTDYTDFIQWRRDGEAMSIIRVSRWPRITTCKTNETYTLDCLPEEIRPCLSHKAWMNVNIAEIRGVRVTTEQEAGNDTCIQGPRGLWLTPVMGAKGNKTSKKRLKGSGILNGYLSLVTRTADQHAAAAEHLAKEKEQVLGEHSIAEVKHMFVLEEDEINPNMVKRNGVWVVKVRGVWWEETQKGMRIYDGLEPSLLQGVQMYTLRCKTNRTTVAEFFHAWIQNKREAKLPAWITTKESKGLLAKVATIKLTNVLTDEDFPQENAENNINRLFPKEYRIPRHLTEYASWFDQQAVVINTNPTEEITITWWEKNRLQCVALGRKYDNITTEVTEANVCMSISVHMYIIYLSIYMSIYVYAIRVRISVYVYMS